jgi:molybdate transport system regulatory protein
MPKLRHPDRLGLHVRVVLDNGVAIGPGKAELLEAIRDTGSIAAA